MLKVKFEQNDSWFLTIIYGSPQPTTRRELWGRLRSILDQIEGEWCAGGDFNWVISPNDTGVSSNLSCDSSNFKNCLFDCGLHDIRFNGQPFTWQRNNIRRRLDRFVANGEWFNRFMEAMAKNLPKLKSDHIPILLDFGGALARNLEEKLFHFLAQWLVHEDFTNLLQNSWHHSDSLEQNISSFIAMAKI